MKKIDTKPYTYVAYYRGIPVYIGKGTGDRLMHTNSGKSTNELLNEFHFRRMFLDDMPLIVHKVSKHRSDTDALAHEKTLIEKYLPYCNKCAGREHEDSYKFRGKLMQLCFDLGYSQPEKLDSKFDFRFLMTPKGLYCKGVYLGKRSPFEYAFNKYHIRLKQNLLVNFPEYSLQFAGVPEDFHSNLASSTGYGFFYKKFIETGGNPFDYLGVSDDWIENAYNIGGFNKYFLPESKYKIKYTLDIEKHKYSKYGLDSHVLNYYRSINDYQKAYHNQLEYKHEKSLVYV